MNPPPSPPLPDAAAYLPHLNPALPFSAAVSIGGLVLLSGEMGVEEDGQVAADFERQAERLFANLDRTLGRLGLPRSAIVKCTVMLQDMADWPRFNAIYLRFFDGAPLPARSAFGCAALALGAKVEMECIALCMRAFSDGPSQT